MSKSAYQLGFLAGACLLALPLCADEVSLKSYAFGVYDQMHGKRKEALTHFQNSAKAEGSAYAPIEKIAGVYTGDKKFDEALKVLDAYTQAFPGHVAAQRRSINLLETMNRGGDYPTAEVLERLHHIDQVEPLMTSNLERLLRLLNNSGKHEESQKLLKEKLLVEGADAGYWLFLLKQSTKLFLTREESAPWEKQILEKLASSPVKNARVARRLSDYYRDEGRKEEALDVLREHLEASPQSLSVRSHLGLLLMHYGQRDKGHDVLLRALEINPRDAKLHSSLSRYYEEEGDEEKALEHQSAALELRGGSAADFVDIAMQYLERDQAHKAFLLMEKTAYYHPDDRVVIAALAISAFHDGDAEKAKSYFDQVKRDELKGDDLWPIVLSRFDVDRADCLLELGEHDAAEPILKVAIRSLGKSDKGLSSRALTLLAVSWIDRDMNEGAARSLLKRALRLQPENQQAELALEKIQK